MGAIFRRVCAAAALAALLIVEPATSGAGATGGQATPQTADELVRTIQAHYEQVRDFSADFVHVYRGGALRKQVTERGTVVIKKPGKMRWTYTAPEPKEFVSDGVKIYSYIPLDKQVIVSGVPLQDQATTPALFLAGRGNLVRDFTASLAAADPAAPAGGVSVKLVPIRPQAEYDALTLVVDRSTWALRALVTADAQGGTSSITFSGLKENRGPSDNTFVFRIPPGTDVITESPRR